MVVLSVPPRLKWAALALLISIPLISLEVSIVARVPVWKLPYQNMIYWAITFALITIPIMVWITAAKRWALSLCAFLAGLWILMSAWMTFHVGYPELGFFTLLLFLFFTAVLLLLKYELGRSFFNPELFWYQGMPKPIPGLKCQLSALSASSDQVTDQGTDKNRERSVKLDVCRLDHDGAFLFSSNKDSESLDLLRKFLARRRLGMVFYFRDRQVECQGAPILSLSQGTGVGIQFLEATDDLNKDIGDLVELLRGEGYV